MARWAIPPNLHHEIAAGPHCFFHEHSIGSRDGRVPRYSDSHACVRCISSLTEGRLSLDVHKIHRKHRRIFLEFWSFVAISEPDDCWLWQGSRYSNADSGYYYISRHWCSGRQFSAPRIAFWFTWGDVGRLPIKPVCGDSLCCNPLHLRAIGVPHYYHNRKMQLIDLEFNSRKLLQETQLFLEATREKAPARYQNIEKVNRRWIEARIEKDSPVDPATLLDMLADLEGKGTE